MSSLNALIAEAADLGGTNLCAGGHAWETEGGRGCDRCGGSQPVFQCTRCDEWDYGDKGGPGDKYCQENCHDEIVNHRLIVTRF